jgi:alkanesulfonate monooxygenase SsuD/methylene tetrahydromethanopterin reductase-like flavin-dependent oxidoreductase (luciferase family)
VKYALNMPPLGSGADARLLADFARGAEEAGWDGFFIWDHITTEWPDALVDITVALTAIALATERIDFGALVTPLARRRPAKFARETASLDHLSGGRLIVGIWARRAIRAPARRCSTRRWRSSRGCGAGMM